MDCKDCEQTTTGKQMYCQNCFQCLARRVAQLEGELDFTDAAWEAVWSQREAKFPPDIAAAEAERDEIREAVIHCGSEEMLNSFLETYRKYLNSTAPGDGGDAQ